MDQFHDGHHVWLRSRALGTYLHADADGQGVSLRESRASLNAAWAVQQLHHRYDLYLLLRSAAYGRYLAATNTRPPLGHPGFRGFRVAQRSYAFLEVGPIMWQAFGALGPRSDDVRLRDVDGRYLRANGKHLPWNHGASVDEFDHLSDMRHWVVEPIPARDGMPALPGQIRVSSPSPCPLLELQPAYRLREIVSWMPGILVQAYLRALLTRAKPTRGSILAKLALLGGALFLNDFHLRISSS
jgi:hypothetical protein